MHSEIPRISDRHPDGEMGAGVISVGKIPGGRGWVEWEYIVHTYDHPGSGHRTTQ